MAGEHKEESDRENDRSPQLGSLSEAKRQAEEAPGEQAGGTIRCCALWSLEHA